MSSWWCAVHGYRHPALDGAVREQLGRMAHVMFGGLTHEPAVRLAERLVADHPGGPRARVLRGLGLGGGGGGDQDVPAVPARGGTRASAARLLTVRGGYHGDTFGAMAVCDPVGGMHSLFTGTLPEHVFADRPPDGFAAPLDERWERWAAQVRELAARHCEELAGVIVEPVVQGAGGMRFHSPACVAAAARGVRRARAAAGGGRDRDGLRPHGRAVRVRARGGQPGRDVRGQGAHGRLHDAGGDALHRGGRRARSPRARAAG